ncbi:hypothetical protein WDW86_09755 [Bdellovibrionota bacterium FG-2]
MIAPSSSLEIPPPIRCAVVQLSRFSDLIQSLMALRAAKQLYPQLEIHLIVREGLEEAAGRVPWIKSLTVLPTQSLLDPILRGEMRESEGLRQIARWIAPLVSEPWDFVMNWSYSEPSSYLTSLLPGRVKMGYLRRRDLSFGCADGWSHYIQAIVQSGMNQNIHLTDILTTQLLTALQIHAGEPANDGNAPLTSKNFFSLSFDSPALNKSGGKEWTWRDISKKWIAIHLGDQPKNQRWNAANWSQLIRLISKKYPEYRFVLLGEAGAKETGRLILSELGETLGRNPVLSLVGQTDFDLFASVIGASQWLFSEESPAIPLASVLGTRVLHLSHAEARWSEVGPYGNGHYIVSDRGGAALTSEAVFCAWSYGAQEWEHHRHKTLDQHFSEHGLALELRKMQVFRSKIRNATDGGGIAYESLVAHPFAVSDWSAMVMGHIARAWYCGWVPPVGKELKRTMINPNLVRELRALEESSHQLEKICTDASCLATLLNRRSAKLTSDRIMDVRDKEDLQSLGKRLMDLDRQIERAGKKHPCLQSFTFMFQVLMHNLNGEHLSDLGRESANSYRQLSDGIAILRDWVKHTLQLAKPRSIGTDAVLSLRNPEVST